MPSVWSQYSLLPSVLPCNIMRIFDENNVVSYCMDKCALLGPRSANVVSAHIAAQTNLMRAEYSRWTCLRCTNVGPSAPRLSKEFYGSDQWCECFCFLEHCARLDHLERQIPVFMFASLHTANKQCARIILFGLGERRVARRNFYESQRKPKTTVLRAYSAFQAVRWRVSITHRRDASNIHSYFFSQPLAARLLVDSLLNLTS